MAQVPYISKIEIIIQQARESADNWAEKDSDKASTKSDILEAFADALEAAVEEFASDWENI